MFRFLSVITDELGRLEESCQKYASVPFASETVKSARGHIELLRTLHFNWLPDRVVASREKRRKCPVDYPSAMAHAHLRHELLDLVAAYRHTIDPSIQAEEAYLCIPVRGIWFSLQICPRFFLLLIVTASEWTTGHCCGTFPLFVL